MITALPVPDSDSGWQIPWAALQVYPWVQAWKGCIQDPIHHAEGDVWIHTRMVLEELVADPAWRALARAERDIVFLSALLHDVAKPSTTRVDDNGRVTARGHSRRGAIDARRILWELGYPFEVREAVCGLIRYHQVPYFLIDDESPRTRLARISQVARCNLLQQLAYADIKGRVCQDLDKVLHNIELFGLYAQEQGCFRAPFQFPTDYGRYLFFRGKDWGLSDQVYDDTRCEVILMCGLPGSGKDRWIREHASDLPVVSMDAIRARRDIEPADNQGAVRHEALEQARVYLRRAQPFVWNATNLLAQRRRQLIDLFDEYRARTRIVYVEASCSRLFEQNRAREQMVPERVIHGMMRMWEVPDATEAPQVEYIVSGL